MIPDRNQVVIFDTTLRDGEQSPGASMTIAEKLKIAHTLVALRVDLIEAGFPIASPGDFEAVQAVSRECHGPIICALARCNNKDIDRAWEALQDASRSRIHVFLATSAIHREFKLHMDKTEIIKRAVTSVKHARSYCEDIEFSPEDAARTELDFLTEVVTNAIEAGATTINIPDTVGYATPEHFSSVIGHLRENVPNINQAVLSVHCHNDLGLAVANSLAGVETGARQVECTINGLGERAGNAALEEIVMALKTREDYYKCTTLIDSKQLFPASRLVSNITGIPVQRNKAIVGQNAFSHEAGIHQHGMLQHSQTYEIMRPEDVGISGTNLVLGKHSGRHAFRERVNALGYQLSDEQFETVFEDFKILADKKKEVYDEDIAALSDHHIRDIPVAWKLISIHTSAGNDIIPTATLSLQLHGNDIIQDAAIGDGPIDAIFKTIERITGIQVILKDYQVRSVSRGKDAQGEVAVEIENSGHTFHGRALSTDIIEASARAYLNALNRLMVHRAYEAESNSSGSATV